MKLVIITNNPSGAQAEVQKALLRRFEECLRAEEKRGEEEREEEEKMQSSSAFPGTSSWQYLLLPRIKALSFSTSRTRNS